ncbi:MAG TPA: ABC transporter permease [Longimicrobiales bacterium]|nr:ABC transporter permease [Longimicrobiales bacterium]
MSTRRRPPELLERWVEAWIGQDSSTPYVIGDLREEYAARSARGGRAPDALWYLVQGARVAARVRWERRRRPRAAAAPVARDGLMADVHQARRFLRRRPGFTAAIVLTVALAVSSVTVAFAVVDGVLLEPLPYRSPDRLVAVWETNPRGEQRNVVSPANYLTWGDELESLESLATIIEASTTLSFADGPERVGVVQASATFFDVVGAEPLIGRLYDETEDAADAEPVAVLAESFWRRRFGADPGVVGTSLRLGDRTVTVVGVLPERFDFEVEWVFSGVGSRDVWAPPMFPPGARQASGRYLQVVGRLAPGATVESAQAEADALAAALAEELPGRQRGWGVNVVPLQADMVGTERSTILVIFGAVVFVLLIACANVANLLLTRASERGQEMAVRGAMGASRGRIARQLLVESGLLSSAGGALGVLAATWGVQGVVGAAPDIPRIDSVGIDGTVLGFALLTTAATAVFFGLVPALRLARADRAAALSGSRASTGRETQRLRSALTVAQVSLSLILLVGAGLLIRSLANRLETGVGFEVPGLLIAEVQTGSGAYPEGEARARFFDQLVERVQSLPGVESASAITWAPLAGGGTRTSFWALDRPVPPAGEHPGADVRWVQRDYHATMGIPLLAGRLFTVEDGADSPLVTLINETGARQLWPDESAVGKRIAMPWGDTLTAEIVGVVEDVRDEGPDTAPYPMFYWDHRQFGPFNQMSLVVRGPEVGRAELVADVRRELAELDPELPLYNVSTAGELLDDALRRARFATTTLTLFALIALALACIGIYGVMAQVAARRTQEIGIRIALGASHRSILRLIVAQGVGHIATAIVIGVVGALALSRYLGSLIYDVSAADPATLVATALLLGAVGLVACWLPARRAALTDPVETMRTE